MRASQSATNSVSQFGKGVGGVMVLNIRRCATAMAAGISFLGIATTAAAGEQAVIGNDLVGPLYTYNALGSYLFENNTSYPYGASTTDSAAATMQLSPYPLVSVSAGSCCGTGYNNPSTIVYANADLIYYAYLIGPNLGPVPMMLQEKLGAGSSGLSYSYADISAGSPGRYYGQEIVSSSNGSLPYDYVNRAPSSPGVLRFVTDPGASINIEIIAHAVIYSGTAWASADPFLSIDPSFASVDPTYATDYSLTFSPGVVNATAPVPEPATWAMMQVGFGTLGAVLRGRRRAVLAA